MQKWCSLCVSLHQVMQMVSLSLVLLKVHWHGPLLAQAAMHSWMSPLSHQEAWRYQSGWFPPVGYCKILYMYNCQYYRHGWLVIKTDVDRAYNLASGKLTKTNWNFWVKRERKNLWKSLNPNEIKFKEKSWK